MDNAINHWLVVFSYSLILLIFRSILMRQTELSGKIERIPNTFPKVQERAREFLSYYSLLEIRARQSPWDCANAHCSLEFTQEVVIHEYRPEGNLPVSVTQFQYLDLYSSTGSLVIAGCWDGRIVLLLASAGDTNFLDYFHRGLVVRNTCSDDLYETITGIRPLPPALGCIEIIHNEGVNVRSHPSFDGRVLGSLALGSIVPYFDIQPSGRTRTINGELTDAGEGNWYQIAPEGHGSSGYAMWVRDGYQGTSYLRLTATDSCNSFTIPTLNGEIAATNQQNFTYPYNPGCNAENGDFIPFSDEEIVLFVLACESDYNYRQAVDIAYIVRSRLMSSSFPDTVIQVVSEEAEFSCLGEPSKWAIFCTNKNDPSIGNTIERIRQEIVIPLLSADSAVNIQLPAPTIPAISYALYTLGIDLYSQEELNDPAFLAAETPDLVIYRLVSNSFWIANTCKSEEELRAIYVGRSEPSDSGLITLYFTEQPGCSNS